MKNVLGFMVVACLLLTISTAAQISSPGLGEAKTASWFAFGMKQKLDKKKQWESMSYIGVGRKSNPDNTHPYYKPAILVFNHEVYYQFHKKWQTSVALSYRRQNEYIDIPDYSPDTPSLIQEFRVYSRISYIIKNNSIKFATTLRNEFRKYYTTEFTKPHENHQFRSRFKLQLTKSLDKSSLHKIILSSEQLFTISSTSHAEQGKNFMYKESRFGFYYSYSPQNTPFTFDIGYVNNLLGSHKPNSVHYLAMDIIINEPFKLFKKK